MRSLLLFLIIPILSFAQETSEDFWRRVFKACAERDSTAFQKAIAPQDEFVYFFKQIDSTIPDSLLNTGYEEYVRIAGRGFRLCQEDITELKLDPVTVKISKVETEDRELLMERNGRTFTPTAKTITIFFTCSGKNFAFMIYDVITIREKFYLGDKIVQLHWLD